MERAWRRTANGHLGTEAGFVINGNSSNYANPTSYTIVETKSGNTTGYQQFVITVGGSAPTFLLFHVHPNESTREPSTSDNNRLGNNMGDTGIANKYNILFLVGHRTGLTLYDPKVGEAGALAQQPRMGKALPGE